MKLSWHVSATYSHAEGVIPVLFLNIHKYKSMMYTLCVSKKLVHDVYTIWTYYDMQTWLQCLRVKKKNKFVA